MDIPQDTYFPLALGPVIIGLRFDQKGYTQALAEYFSPATPGNAPDVFIDFTLVEHDDFPEIPQSLIQSKKWTKGTFSIAENLFRGKSGPTAQTWEIEVKTIMTKGQITRVFEQFLYQAFYTACSIARKPGILIHSSGIAVDGRGFLFVGPSGMGKSTIAEMSRGYEVFNDEMNILTPEGSGGYRVNPSPFNAYFEGKTASSAPLKAIFLLRHADECRLETISPAMAVAEITGQVVPPLGLEDAYTQAVATRMMEIAFDLTAKVPVRLLYFPREGGFWPLVLDTFR